MSKKVWLLLSDVSPTTVFVRVVMSYFSSRPPVPLEVETQSVPEAVLLVSELTWNLRSSIVSEFALLVEPQKCSSSKNVLPATTVGAVAPELSGSVTVVMDVPDKVAILE